ncbi:hypothetical protein D3C78_1617140 [compost metagenome]
MRAEQDTLAGKQSALFHRQHIPAMPNDNVAIEPQLQVCIEPARASRHWPGGSDECIKVNTAVG